MLIYFLFQSGGSNQFSDANAESAFLGPRLWSKPISLPVADDDEDDEPDFSVMNIEDFLNENNIDMDENTNASSITSPGLVISSLFCFLDMWWRNDQLFMDQFSEKGQAALNLL